MYVKATDDFYIGFHARNKRKSDALGMTSSDVVGHEYWVQESEIEDKSYYYATVAVRVPVAPLSVAVAVTVTVRCNVHQEPFKCY